MGSFAVFGQLAGEGYGSEAAGVVRMARSLLEEWLVEKRWHGALFDALAVGGFEVGVCQMCPLLHSTTRKSGWGF